MVKRESRKWVEKVHRKSEFGTGVCELELWAKSSFSETLAKEEDTGWLLLNLSQVFTPVSDS